MRLLLHTLVIIVLLLGTACQTVTETTHHKMPDPIQLTLQQAERLAQLPLKCIVTPLPYKPDIVVAKKEDLQMQKLHHPAFFGCYDWHSAVHGHWSLVYLMKRFPELSVKEDIIRIIDQNLTTENISAEIAYFSMNKYSETFERAYGWAWLFKLSEELKTWDDPNAKRWYAVLQPLAQLISKKYQSYLPKLVYPIRVGEHQNTAFSMGFAYDYAQTIGDEALTKVISKRARDFYMSDVNCPINWEPSGHDFLSPCLQELNIMRKVLSNEEFSEWSTLFLPQLSEPDFSLEPAEVRDRSDGKLVHLDGLNFSRAWCLYGLHSDNPAVVNTANQHLNYSLNKITDGNYSGEHWLASFALYAFKTRRE